MRMGVMSLNVIRRYVFVLYPGHMMSCETGRGMMSCVVGWDISSALLEPKVP
jgi:hypothetical protein